MRERLGSFLLLLHALDWKSWLILCFMSAEDVSYFMMACWESLVGDGYFIARICYRGNNDA